ncbi:MAG: DMT family transporter [Alphaproteobacteria bacterium]|nr:DMT family transporter [Alphaproteobacteria bacterium]
MTSSPPSGPASKISRDALIAMSWAVASAFFYSLVPVGVRLLAQREMPPIEIVFFRNAIGFAVFAAFFAWRGFGTLRTQRFGLHLQRNVANFVGMWLWFAALAVMPLSKAIALHFTEPMMAAILAVFILGERPGIRRLVAIGAGFVGVLIILRPGAIPTGLPALMVLGSAFLYACVTIYSRVLGRTDAPSTTIFYYQAMLMAFSLIPAAWVWVWPGWGDLPGLILIGVFGTIAPYCIVRALRHAETTLVLPFGFLRLPFTAAMAFVLFAEPTEVWTWIGAAVIFTATYFVTRGERRA